MKRASAAVLAGSPPIEPAGTDARRYRQLVELAPDGILIHDGQNILLANEAAARLAGVDDPDAMVGLPIDEFLNPPHLKDVQARLIAAGVLAGVAQPVRDSFRRRDGSTVEVEVTAIGFMDGRRTSVHLVIRDVSARLAVQHTARLAAEQFQHAQRMEAVGALAGGVAHEVNNMMAVILGFGDFLLQDRALGPTSVADIGEIIKAADRAARVTQQLLAFGRRAIYRPEAFDLATAVRNFEPTIERLLGAGLPLVIVAGSSARVWADRGQFEQVLVNLALNARDAMRAGGTLTVTTSEVELGPSAEAYGSVRIPAGPYACMAVRDTGTGIDAATAARLFEPFFTTKPVGQGTGLGLAAVYGILQQNRAYIVVDSAPECGATFTLFYPIASADAVERLDLVRASVPREATGGGATVLLVEDEPVVRTVAARALEMGGFRVVQAPDGAAALEIIALHGVPDLVLTDLMMPGMGGAELGRLVRDRWPSVPILFMSGYSSDDLHRQGAIGADQVTIQKPFTPDALNAAAAAALIDRVAAGEL